VSEEGGRSPVLKVEPGQRPDPPPRPRHPRGRIGDQWLALVVPSAARSFRAQPEELAATLAEAGAQVAAEGPVDAEIVSMPRDVRGADIAIVSIGPSLGGAPRSAGARAVLRAVGHARTKVVASRAVRALRARGYETTTLPWDLAHPLSAPPFGASGNRPRKERLPRRALVVGRRHGRTPTILEAVLTEASESSGIELAPREGSVRAGFLLVTDDSTVLRVAVGPSRDELIENARALSYLHARDGTGRVRTLVPRVLATGRSGLADWTLESRIRGSALPTRADAATLSSCIDFLESLHLVPGAGDDRVSFVDCAREVAPACAASDADLVTRIGEALDERLADVPRGFAHGDFFPGNVLLDAGGLAGVIDWDGGGPGRVPLVDLLHLVLHVEDPPRDDEWGPELVRRLLPWASAGGDGTAADYLSRVRAADAPLVDLVVAYWLERTAYQLRARPIRWEQPDWIAANVRSPLPAMARAVGL
jgi:aminoglycoside phosphotransferase (APT) family kinase protein